MRTVNLFGAAILALSTSAYSFGALAQDPAPATPPADSTAPAPDAGKPEAKKPAHHMHKAMMGKGKGKLADTKSGDKAVEDLNDASLSAAKSDKPFTPPPTPEAATKEAHVGDKGTTKPMHHKMMKKAKKADDAAKTDAAPPATDAAPPADAPK